MGSPGWQNIVFPLSLLSWPPLFVSSPSVSPGRHSISSQVAYLLVRQCNVPSAALQPELTVDWLVAAHWSPLIVLKWSCSLRPKTHFPWARERRGGERRGKTERLNSLKWDEDRWKKVKARTGKCMERDKREQDIFLIEVQGVCLCMQKCTKERKKGPVLFPDMSHHATELSG